MSWQERMIMSYELALIFSCQKANGQSANWCFIPFQKNDPPNHVMLRP